MKVNDILVCEMELVFVDDENNILSEAAIRQWKRTGKEVQQKYRCLSGNKKGKLVSNPSDCSKRKDPKKVRQGRKTMRSKKGIIGRKAKITKKTSMSKMVAKMNKRLSGL